jgi:cell division protein FtsB
MKIDVVGCDDDDAAAAIAAIARSSSLMSLERETALRVAPDSSTV